MAIFVDTSALLAYLNDKDRFHTRAADFWRGLDNTPEQLETHNYVVTETIALLQTRHGLSSVAKLRDEVLPLVETRWVDEVLHESALAAVISSSQRAIGLVDRVSFELMRRRGVARAFAFDSHFAEAGFELVPAQA